MVVRRLLVEDCGDRGQGLGQGAQMGRSPGEKRKQVSASVAEREGGKACAGDCRGPSVQALAGGDSS